MAEETIIVNGKSYTKTAANSAWFKKSSFTPEFYRGQADRAVAFLNAGLNPDVAEKCYDQMQYQYYKSAAVACESESPAIQSSSRKARHQLGRVDPELAHKALDKRSQPQTKEQTDLTNDVIHANDYQDPAIKFKKQNPFWGPSDHSDEAQKQLSKLFPS